MNYSEIIKLNHDQIMRWYWYGYNPRQIATKLNNTLDEKIDEEITVHHYFSQAIRTLIRKEKKRFKEMEYAYKQSKLKR